MVKQLDALPGAITMCHEVQGEELATLGTAERQNGRLRSHLRVLQAAHKATLELLGWLLGTNAMSRELLDDALAVLGATAACAAGPEAAAQLVAALTAVKRQVSHRVATELAPGFKDALVRSQRLRCLSIAVCEQVCTTCR